MEGMGQFILPLHHKIAGTDNQATFKVSTDNQFTDEKSGHNGFACSRVISRQKPQRLTRQHGLIHRRSVDQKDGPDAYSALPQPDGKACRHHQMSPPVPVGQLKDVSRHHGKEVSPILPRRHLGTPGLMLLRHATTH
jgi:hypothetical protein